MKLPVSDYTMRQIEDRVQALAPLAPKIHEEAAAGLEAEMPSVMKVLRGFPRARWAAIEAIRAAPSADVRDWAPVFWEALKPFPEASKAIIASLDAERMEKMSPAERQEYREKERKRQAQRLFDEKIAEIGRQRERQGLPNPTPSQPATRDNPMGIYDLLEAFYKLPNESKFSLYPGSGEQPG